MISQRPIVHVRDMTLQERREASERQLRHALYQVAGTLGVDVMSAATFARGYMIAKRLKVHEMEERMRR